MWEMLGKAGHRRLHIPFCHSVQNAPCVLHLMMALAVHVSTPKALLPAAKHCLAQSL